MQALQWLQTMTRPPLPLPIQWGASWSPVHCAPSRPLSARTAELFEGPIPPPHLTPIPRACPVNRPRRACCTQFIDQQREGSRSRPFHMSAAADLGPRRPRCVDGGVGAAARGAPVPAPRGKAHRPPPPPLWLPPPSSHGATELSSSPPAPPASPRHSISSCWA